MAHFRTGFDFLRFSSTLSRISGKGFEFLHVFSNLLVHFGNGFEILRVFLNLLAHFGKEFDSGAKGVRPGGRNALNPKRTLIFLRPEPEFSLRVQFGAPKAQKGFSQAQIGFGQAQIGVPKPQKITVFIDENRPRPEKTLFLSIKMARTLNEISKNTIFID